MSVTVENQTVQVLLSDSKATITTIQTRREVVTAGIQGPAGGAGGIKRIWVPAASMWVPQTNGATAASLQNQVADNMDILFVRFSAGGDERANFAISMPNGWDLGSLTAQFWWTSQSAGSGDVEWDLRAFAIANSDTLNNTFSAAPVTVTDTFLNVNQNHISAESGAITVDGIDSADDLILFQVRRTGSSDTFDQAADLMGIKIGYTATTLTDE